MTRACAHSLARVHVLALALALAACPTPTLPAEPDAALAVVAYRDALVQNRPRDAFEWIHPDAREGLDAQFFEALYLRHREALIAQAEELVRLTGDRPAAQRARVHTDRGDVVLEHGPEGWRLLGPVGRSP